jgi:hypothetical protein
LTKPKSQRHQLVMAKGAKRLEEMRNNPRDWRVGDVQVVCRAFDVGCAKPNGTSHFTVSDPTQKDILTIVAKRPIKPFYIKELVSFIDRVMAARALAARKEKRDGDEELQDCRDGFV